MPNNNPSAPQVGGQPGQSVDLLKETDVAYWCEIFGCDPTQLRQAVQAAGNNAEDVGRHLRSKGAPDRA